MEICPSLADGDGLENRITLKSDGGSNPSISSNISSKGCSIKIIRLNYIKKDSTANIIKTPNLNVKYLS